MKYAEAVTTMIDKCKNALDQKAADYSCDYRPEPKYQDIVLEYPGYAPKRKKKGWPRIIGDYRLSIEQDDSKELKPISHFEICKQLFKVSKGKYEEFCKLLNDICQNGTDIDFSKYVSIDNSEKIAKELFWLTVQEDILYPPNNINKGHVLSFYRFFEAVYAAEYDASIMDELEERCKGQPELYNIGNVPHPSYYAFIIDF